MDYMIAVIALLFAGSVAFDFVALMPRLAGCLLRLNGVGYSISAIVLTFKRVFASTYPPALGVILTTGNRDLLYKAIFFSYAGAALAIGAIVILKQPLLRYFLVCLEKFQHNGRLFAALFKSLPALFNANSPSKELLTEAKDVRFKLGSFDRSIFLQASWIYFFNMATVFIINLMSLHYPEKSAILLQSGGFLSAMGSLMLAFFLDPQLSRRYEKQDELKSVWSSLILAHLANIFCLSLPIFAIAYFTV